VSSQNLIEYKVEVFMALLISRNGKIQDFKRPSQARRVNSVDDRDLDNKVHFEDVLEKEESSPENPFSKEKSKDKTRDKTQAIKSYLQQKEQSKRHTKLLHARDVCSSPVVTLTPQDRVEKAIELMEKYRIHHLPLIGENGIICGIVSDRDLLRERPSNRLERHMSKEVLIARDTTEIKMIARMMIENEISALPLVDEEEHLVGIITKTDLLECLVRSMPYENYV
jgi:CBS domain-containing protein